MKKVVVFHGAYASILSRAVAQTIQSLINATPHALCMYDPIWEMMVRLDARSAVADTIEGKTLVKDHCDQLVTAVEEIFGEGCMRQMVLKELAMLPDGSGCFLIPPLPPKLINGMLELDEVKLFHFGAAGEDKLGLKAFAADYDPPQFDYYINVDDHQAGDMQPMREITDAVLKFFDIIVERVANNVQ